MTLYPGKAAVNADKLRGGYYTPQPVARFLASWVANAGPKLLEPSCGDGRILAELARASDSVYGVEILETEAAKARHYAPVTTASFFDWLAPDQTRLWDGVAGNPPYIRFGNWPEADRQPALQLMTSVGLRPTRLTNAWVPFVVGSVVAVRSGGRVGLVLPAELLQVTYAAQLRDYLVREFAEITLVTFERLVFDGILQEVVLFMGVKGAGPAKIRTVHVSDASDLEGVDTTGQAAPALLHEQEKWTKYFLPAAHVALLRRLRESDDLTRLGELAEVDVGIVTGRNSFFTFNDDQVRALNLQNHCVPLVSRSAQLTGSVYDDECRQQDLLSRHRTWILDAPDELTSPELVSHVRSGEEAGVHLGYKCSIRKPWWRTPSLWIPDLFMLRQIHRAPRMTVNNAGATSTDTVHRVRLMGDVDARALSTVFHNSITSAFAEVMGRSYGGGILELEPREAESLPVPRPHLASAELATDVDNLLKANESEKAFDLVDQQILVEQLGLAPELVSECRSAWIRLRDRRTKRGRRNEARPA